VSNEATGRKNQPGCHLYLLTAPYSFFALFCAFLRHCCTALGLRRLVAAFPREGLPERSSLSFLNSPQVFQFQLSIFNFPLFLGESPDNFAALPIHHQHLANRIHSPIPVFFLNLDCGFLSSGVQPPRQHPGGMPHG
jgi:hypothetical protein